jgi:hypothetical protein
VTGRQSRRAAASDLAAPRGVPPSSAFSSLLLRRQCCPLYRPSCPIVIACQVPRVGGPGPAGSPAASGRRVTWRAAGHNCKRGGGMTVTRRTRIFRCVRPVGARRYAPPRADSRIPRRSGPALSGSGLYDGVKRLADNQLQVASHATRSQLRVVSHTGTTRSSVASCGQA